MTMIRPANTSIIANRGSDVVVSIVLRGTDNSPIDLLEDPTQVSLIDLSSQLGTPTVDVSNVVLGLVTITIAWDNARVNGQVYTFRVVYANDATGLTQTTPLFELVYQ